MIATVDRPLRDSARRAYRDAIREALSLGVKERDLAMVVARFLGENPDPVVFRQALIEYVPLTTFREQDRAATRAELSRAAGERERSIELGHFR